MGQFLFFDKRMSPSGKISCATCHDPNKGWSDGRALSKGMEVLPRNSPTLWNVVYNRWQFWDGRADSLWSQARGPIEAGQEMGSSRLFVIHYVSNTPEVKKAYQALFGKLPDFSDTKRFPKHGKPVDDDPDDPLHKAWSGMKKKDQTLVNRVFSNILKVIAAYEGTIVSKDAPFDTFVAGLKENNASKLKALSLSAQRGMKLFVGKGQCTLCHTGPNFTDKEFHNIGLSTPKGKSPDVGRFAGIEVVLKDIFNGLGPFSDNKTDPIHKRLRYLRPTPSKNEMGEFKTPTLRNIATSAPYMHDGRFGTLNRVVLFYSLLNEKVAIGHREESLQRLALSQQESMDLVNFLKSLTGKPLPTNQTTPPKSPSLP